MSRGGEVSVDHEFVGDQETCAKVVAFGRGNEEDARCERPRSEHPPAQVVEADCRHCQAGLPYVPFGQPSPGGNYHRIHSAAPAAPTDPARKPADEDEAAAREWLREHKHAWFTSPGVDVASLARFREQGRQAGAEEMREACAKVADSYEHVSNGAGAAAEEIRALPLPEPRS